MKKILFLLCCSSVAFATNLRFDTDIAVDPSTGLSYFAEKENNPMGLIAVYNQKGEAIYSFSAATGGPVRKLEMELPRSSSLLILQQFDRFWSLKKLGKERSGWNPHAGSTIEGEGVATNIETVDSEHVIIDVKPVDGGESKTLLIEDKSELKIIDSVSTETLAAQAEKAANSIKPAPAESKKGGLGLAAGNLGGMGFAYRRHFENKLGFQVGGIWSADDNSSYSNFGGQLIRTISRSERVRLFAMGGAGIYRKESHYEICRPIDPTIRDPNFVCDETTQRTRTLNFGGGIGFEFLLLDNRLGFTAELPLTWKYNKDAPPGTRTLKGPSTIPAASIVYYFGGKK